MPLSSASHCCSLPIPVASSLPIPVASSLPPFPSCPGRAGDGALLPFQMNNYLTVPAHKLDSPTMSRARIGSGRWEGAAGGAAPGAPGGWAVLHLLGSLWLSSPGHTHPTPIQPSHKGLLFQAEAPTSLPSTIPTGKPGWALSGAQLAPSTQPRLCPCPSQPSSGERVRSRWIPSFSITHSLCHPRFLLSCVASCSGDRVSGVGV